MICGNCASIIKSREPEQYEFKACKCDYCNEKSYCASESAWGISTNEKVGEEGFEILNNFFNTK